MPSVVVSRMGFVVDPSSFTDQYRSHSSVLGDSGKTRWPSPQNMRLMLLKTGSLGWLCQISRGSTVLSAMWSTLPRGTSATIRDRWYPPRNVGRQRPGKRRSTALAVSGAPPNRPPPPRPPSPPTLPQTPADPPRPAGPAGLPRLAAPAPP